MKRLQKDLARIFKAPIARKPDPCRKAREEAKRLAKEHGIEIERVDSGFNVWPPRERESDDPWAGDHYCQDWCEALTMVREYAGVSADA